MVDTPKTNNSSISGSFTPIIHKACWKLHTTKAITKKQLYYIEPGRTFTCAWITYDDEKLYLVHERVDAPVAMRLSHSEEAGGLQLEFYVNKDILQDEVTVIANFMHLLEEASLYRLSYDVFGVNDNDLTYTTVYNPLVGGLMTVYRAENVYQEAAIETKYLRTGLNTQVIETVNDVDCEYPVFLLIHEEQSSGDIQIRRCSLETYKNMMESTSTMESLKSILPQE